MTGQVRVAGEAAPRGPLNPYGGPGIPEPVNPRERELLTGMGNCYAACGSDFEATVGMVAESRRRTPEDVKLSLSEMKQRFGRDPDYRALRSRLPDSFPL